MQLDSIRLGALVLVTILAQANCLPSYTLTIHPELVSAKKEQLKQI